MNNEWTAFNNEKLVLDPKHVQLKRNKESDMDRIEREITTIMVSYQNTLLTLFN